uniref:Retroviral envelope protein GP41-like domain-containing protein n=1 Tax=Otolemur garnettii TaxID=30611 RepID=H0XK29_OTOGA
IPAYLPMPVNRTTNFPISLSRQKRDFGIIAATVTIIATLAASAVAAKIAVSTSLQTAHTLNNLSALTAQALDSQQLVNTHLKLAILNLNQQTFLLQEQVELLWNLQGVSCLPPFNSICVTPWKVKNASKVIK